MTAPAVQPQTVAVPDGEGLYVEFGKRLKALREAKKLSQTDLAGLVRVSRTSLINIEQGGQGVPLHLLLSLAIALGMDLDELVTPTLKEQVRRELLGRVPAKDREWVRLVVGGPQVREVARGPR